MVTVAERIGTTAHRIAIVSLESWKVIARAAAELAIPDEPERRCSVCGMVESATDFESLVDVRVVVANGEEGFADITQLLCDDHLPGILDGLVALGFVDHRHGGINFLEDPSCPGYRGGREACPTPSEYGEYIVGQANA